jgi:RNA polymerase sigma factor (sigma-70 family)
MDDLEFVQRCVKGDSRDWDEFLKRYSRLIYNYIHKVLDAKGQAFTQEHINDIFQEIFCALIKDNFKRLRSFKARNGCSLASWLRQVTINFTIDYLRKIKPAVSLDEEIGEDFSLKDVLADKTAFITDTLSHEERLKSLNDCIDKLGRDDKYFLELLINRGLKPEELKEHLRLSRGAIDMRKSRIIERLRDCFRSKGFALDFAG